MIRVFIAADIPDEFRKSLAEVQNELRFTKAKLSYVDPEIAHITIKFIGDTSAEKLAQVKKALEGLKFSPYEISFKGVFFNNPSRPRVVWASGYDNGRSSALKSEVEDLLEPLDIAREKRKFNPHVTVARVKRFHPSLADCMVPLGDYDFGSFEINSLKLKSSILKPSGPVYDDLMEVNF